MVGSQPGRRGSRQGREFFVNPFFSFLSGFSLRTEPIRSLISLVISDRFGALIVWVSATGFALTVSVSRPVGSLSGFDSSWRTC